jgi:plastocyanin
LSRRMLTVLGLSAVLSLALAACGSSAASVAPSAAPSAAASAPAASAAAACAESGAAGTVKVSIKDFAFNPAAITAKVGDVITFTNGDTAGHTATLDDGSCFTPTIAPSKSDGLTFTAAGTYTFHCAIHSSMKGTITVS